MPYQVSIAENGADLFRTSPYNAFTVQALQSLFTLLDAKFPEQEGYTLTVRRCESPARSIRRATFGATAAAGDPKRLLQLFVEDEAFQAFRQRREKFGPQECGDDETGLDDYEHVTEVIFYAPGFYILQTIEEDVVSYVLPAFSIPDFISHDLEELEYELYLAYTERPPF